MKSVLSVACLLAACTTLQTPSAPPDSLLVLDADKGETLRVRAIRASAYYGHDPVRLEAAVRSQNEGVTVRHFSGPCPEYEEIRKTAFLVDHTTIKAPCKGIRFDKENVFIIARRYFVSLSYDATGRLVTAIGYSAIPGL